MEYLDFSSVITTIRKYISDAHSMNQIDMMYQLFVSLLNSEESQDFDFDNGLVYVTIPKTTENQKKKRKIAIKKK